jgi:hypothetical protein
MVFTLRFEQIWHIWKIGEIKPVTVHVNEGLTWKAFRLKEEIGAVDSAGRRGGNLIVALCSLLIRNEKVIMYKRANKYMKKSFSKFSIGKSSVKTQKC